MYSVFEKEKANLWKFRMQIMFGFYPLSEQTIDHDVIIRCCVDQFHSNFSHAVTHTFLPVYITLYYNITKCGKAYLKILDIQRNIRGMKRKISSMF